MYSGTFDSFAPSSEIHAAADAALSNNRMLSTKVGMYPNTGVGFNGIVKVIQVLSWS